MGGERGLREMIIPKEYFVTGGKGVSRVSSLNALDLALWEARIGHLNLVPVTSIIPPNAVERSYVELPPGAVTFAVMAVEQGEGGEVISAGLVWAEGRPHGYVLEACGKVGREELEKRLWAMAAEVEKYSAVKFSGEWRVRVESIEVPADAYGAVVVALVLV
ncbi:MAG: pyruvoyl-dependent arginine decarboxylase [Thermoprotei archaeon]|nr:MAG: pyruvoyl-dependent arginine decarboxylase [Thermoprotei archaeon]